MFCWLHKLTIANRLDDDVELPRRIRAHLGHCAGCRGYYDQERRLVEQLTQAAATDRREAPPFLRARILANLGSAVPEASVWHRARLAAWAMGAVAVLAIAALFLSINPAHPPAPGDRSAGVAEEAAPWPATYAALTNLTRRGAALALNARLDQPLENELSLVVADATSALTSLSHSFVPFGLFSGPR